MYEYPINFEKIEIKEPKRILHPSWRCYRQEDGTLITYQTMNQELIETLDKITWEILENNPNFDKFAEEWGLTILNVKYAAGYGFTSVDCMSFNIWSSEDDEREFDDDKDEYESWDTYFRSKINKLIDNKIIGIKKL